jgi:BMFP domain-containing protein YqiC
MQTDNRFLDDLARVIGGAVSAAAGVREEVEAKVRHQLDGVFSRMDLVTREEFEVVRDMAALARQENERLAARLGELEARLAKSDKPKPKRAATGSSAKKTSTAATKKADKAG